MPSLQVRELPENVYRLLRERARAEHRSLAQEAVSLLARGLATPESPRSRRQELLLKITQLELAKPGESPDPATLIREDRER